MYPCIHDETIISTVGAGDAFGSCFVASRAQGQSIEQSMVQGILNSISVLQHESAQEGLLTADELQGLYKGSPQELINSFTI